MRAASDLVAKILHAVDDTRAGVSGCCRAALPRNVEREVMQGRSGRNAAEMPACVIAYCVRLGPCKGLVPAALDQPAKLCEPFCLQRSLHRGARGDPLLEREQIRECGQIDFHHASPVRDGEQIGIRSSELVAK